MARVPPTPTPLVWSRPFHDRVPSHQHGTPGQDQSWGDRSQAPYWTWASKHATGDVKVLEAQVWAATALDGRCVSAAGVVRVRVPRMRCGWTQG